MSEKNDVKRLADLLKEQRDATLELAVTRDPAERERLTCDVKAKRDQWELVDRYFRQTLRPVLAKRFPGKGIQSAPHNERVHSNDVMFRYTELVGDFFVQVLSKFDDPFWKKDSAIELRNYASTVISRDILDGLKRRRKREQLTDEQVRTAFEDQLAAEVEQKFFAEGLGLDLADVLETIDQWQRCGDDRQQKMAVLLRHKYVSEMTMQQIADDLKIPLSTTYRYHTEAIASLRDILCSCNGS